MGISNEMKFVDAHQPNGKMLPNDRHAATHAVPALACPVANLILWAAKRTFPRYLTFDRRLRAVTGALRRCNFGD